MSNLPTNAKARKDMPICRGLLDYFPDACAAVAELSRIGNDQHNPGEPMHWARGKSMDQADCIVRHLIERGTYDTDGQLHSVKIAWRALALAQLDIEEHAKEAETYARDIERLKERMAERGMTEADLGNMTDAEALELMPEDQRWDAPYAPVRYSPVPYETKRLARLEAENSFGSFSD